MSTKGEKLRARVLEERKSQWSGKGAYKDPVEPKVKVAKLPSDTWTVVSIDQIAIDTTIGLVRSAALQNSNKEGVPYLKMDKIDMEGRVDLEDLVYVDATDEELQRFSLRKGDVLFNTRNSVELVGKTGYIAAEPSTQTVFNNNLMRLRFVESVLPAFVATQMCSKVFRDHMEGAKRATTSIAAVYGKDLRPLPIALPPPGEQRRIVSKIEELFSKLDAGVAALKQAKAQLKRYRQSVLAAAVTGELTKDLPCRQAGWPACQQGKRSKSFRNISDKRVPEPANGQGRESESYFAYVLECNDGSLYKGFAKDLFTRINQHLEVKGAKWTCEHPPVSLVHFEEFSTEKEAVEREKYFKSGAGREWLNEVRNRQNEKHEPASKLLDRILTQRRELWTGRGKYKEPIDHGGSDIKEIPESWVWSSFESTLSELRNGISKKPDATEGLRILRISAVRPRTVDLEDSRFLPDALSDFSIYELKQNDLLFTRYNGTRAFVGVCGLVPLLNEPFVYPDKLIRARLVNPALLLPAFVEIAMSAGESRRFIEKCIRTTAGQSGISGQDIKVTPLPIPPLAEQKQIIAEVDARTTAIDHIESELDQQLIRSNRLRQSTLQTAFAGHLSTQI